MKEGATRNDMGWDAPDGLDRRSSAILVVDDEPGIRKFLSRSLGKRYAMVETAETVEEAESLRQRCHFDLIIADIRMPGGNGMRWMESLREQGSVTDVIFMTAYADLETAIGAIRTGAADFLLKPFRMEQMTAAVSRCLERRRMTRENFVLRRQVDQVYAAQEAFVGQCKLMRDVCNTIKRIATMPSTVLIQGESGTGKELAARSTHELSGRSGPFVPINCGAISAELIESELFGHMKGSFTGAHQAREGLFSYAEAGTLFLDEIGEMPLPMQAKLLRFMEERTIRPVGSNQEIRLDARIIAATNRNLAQDVVQGRFRQDLFYRLNVVTLPMPPLREHVEDLPLLTRHFLATLSAELGLPAPQVSEAEFAEMAAYAWPGNVRELRNVIERSLLLGQPPTQYLLSQIPASDMQTSISDGAGLTSGEDMTLQQAEKQHILQVLDRCSGNKSRAALRLEVSRKTLERKLKTWRLENGGTD